MRNNKIVITVAVLLGCFCPALLSAQEVHFDVYAHWVSWYTQQNPGVHEHQWDESSVLPLRRGPGVGEGYSSSDPDIIRQHYEDFLTYGITPLASWWGPGHRAGDGFYDAFLAIPSPVKVGVLYEVTGLLKATKADNGGGDVYDFDDPANVQKFVADIRYLRDTYFRRFPERFATIDGRPIVFIWLTGLFRGDFAHAAKQVEDEVYLIGSEISPYPPGRNTMERLGIIRGLDALSAYGTQYDDFHNGRLDAEFVGQQISAYRLWSRWLQIHAPGVELIIPTQFSANDTGIPDRAPHSQPYISSYDEAYYAAEQWREFLVDAYLGCILTNVRPAMYVTSYNELVEGTALEAWRVNPDIPQPFPFDAGYDYLNVLKAVFGPSIASSPPSCRQ